MRLGGAAFLIWYGASSFLIAYSGGAVLTAETAPLESLASVLASFVFFFSLGYGAHLLAPIFVRPKAWRILDVIIGIIMWAIALQLMLH